MSDTQSIPWRPVAIAVVVAAAIALVLHVVSVATGDRTPVEGANPHECYFASISKPTSVIM